MLTQLRIKNFRCFDEHSLSFRKNTVIVGRNNAGKSTVIEALKLVSLVSNRHRYLNPIRVPKEANVPLHTALSPSLQHLDLKFDTAAHGLGQLPSVIEAEFDSGETIQVYVGADHKLYGALQRPSGSRVITKGEAGQLGIRTIQILPQVAPLERTEMRLSSLMNLTSISILICSTN
ncbi:MAG: AAA family ATPase [Chloroflexi bacterium]|nr:AAA family ATPase [Chloroflexota bacterium]